MGGKYQVRYYVGGDPALLNPQYRDEYVHSLWDFLKLLYKYRRKLIFFTVRF